MTVRLPDRVSAATPVTMVTNIIRTPRSGLTWWQNVVVITLASLVYIQVAGLVGTRLLVPVIGWNAEGIQPVGEKADSVEGRFARWDSGYYLQIAQDGYRPDGAERAFFPLYPVLIRQFSNISGLSLLWAGWIVSIVCTVAASLILYRWVLIDHDGQTAKWSVVWFCFFPVSFFFVSLYAEAPFLLASIASAYFARRGQFVVSGLAIAIAGATRLPAFLLAVPYNLEFWLQRDFRRLRCLQFAVGALIAPFGMLGYLLSLAAQTGKLDLQSLYLSNLTSGFDRSLAWPWVTLYDGVRSALFGAVINPDWFSRVEVWQDLAYACLGLIFAVWALFRLRLSWAALLLVSMLFLYSSHGPYGYAFWSMPRYVAAVFPIYLVLAILTIQIPSRFRRLLLSVSIGLLGFLSAWFVSGRWVA